jgi:hypothetical protein
MHRPNPKFLLVQKGETAHDLDSFHCTLNRYWDVTGEEPSYTIALNQGILLVYGDWVNPSAVQADDVGLSKFIADLKGHCVVVLVESEKVKIASSYFSFLSVYYHQEKKVVSNHWEVIVPFSNHVIDELFVLESHLFNYPLGGSTIYQDVKVLDSFSILELCQEEFIFDTLIDIRSWFPKQVDDSIGLDTLAQQFISSIEPYFTSERELITFTSGFDGRTILASALAFKKEVYTFSMGRMENDDVYNPKSNAEELKIPFETIDLASDKYQSEFLHSARRMSQISGGRNGFLYPHFYYCTDYYNSYPVMHTGYCGSELFRALHVAGAVTSKELVSIFLEEDEGKLKETIFQSKRLRFIHPKVIERNETALWERIDSIRSMRNQFNNTNHFFYYFIFKEVFRKVFGFWTTTQFENIKVRTPFLDISFIQLLLKSAYAGCNNSFFTHNPLKRYKGQLLYAQILKNLHSPLFQMMTGKNYKPSQLLSFQGQLSIVLPYIKKKWRKKKMVPNIDNLGLITGFKQSWKVFDSGLDNLSEIYSLDDIRRASGEMHPHMSEVERDMLFQIASLSLTLKDDEIVGANRL